MPLVLFAAAELVEKLEALVAELKPVAPAVAGALESHLRSSPGSPIPHDLVEHAVDAARAGGPAEHPAVEAAEAVAAHVRANPPTHAEPAEADPTAAAPTGSPAAGSPAPGGSSAAAPAPATTTPEPAPAGAGGVAPQS